VHYFCGNYFEMNLYLVGFPVNPTDIIVAIPGKTIDTPTSAQDLVSGTPAEYSFETIGGLTNLCTAIDLDVYPEPEATVLIDDVEGPIGGQPIRKID